MCESKPGAGVAEYLPRRQSAETWQIPQSIWRKKAGKVKNIEGRRAYYDRKTGFYLLKTPSW